MKDLNKYNEFSDKFDAVIKRCCSLLDQRITDPGNTEHIDASIAAAVISLQNFLASLERTLPSDNVVTTRLRDRLNKLERRVQIVGKIVNSPLVCPIRAA